MTYWKKQKIIRCKFIPSIILYKNQHYQRVDQRKRKKKKKNRTTIDLLVKFTYHSEMSAQKCSTKCPSGVADSLDVIRRQKSPHLNEQAFPGGGIYLLFNCCLPRKRSYWAISPYRELKEIESLELCNINLPTGDFSKNFILAKKKMFLEDI